VESIVLPSLLCRSAFATAVNVDFGRYARDYAFDDCETVVTVVLDAIDDIKNFGNAKVEGRASAAKAKRNRSRTQTQVAP
jgi:hypothetical protein